MIAWPCFTNRKLDLAADQDEQQRRVFRTLADAYPAPMTRAELETALGRLDASDGLHPVVDSGTVHQRDDLVWPTRCVMKVYDLFGG